MKQQTRDNLIYLAIGIGVASLVVGDAFYAESHGRKMWMPSRFAYRVVTTPTLLVYFVVREMRQKVGFLQLLASALFATFVQLIILFAFRQIIDQLPGLTFSAFAALDIFWSGN